MATINMLNKGKNQFERALVNLVSEPIKIGTDVNLGDSIELFKLPANIKLMYYSMVVLYTSGSNTSPTAFKLKKEDNTFIGSVNINVSNNITWLGSFLASSLLLEIQLPDSGISADTTLRICIGYIPLDTCIGTRTQR